jgi:probable HAF family extracellular repeat protein
MKRIHTILTAATALITLAGLGGSLAAHADGLTNDIPTPAKDPTYSVFDLGTLAGGNRSEGTALNSYDEVVGWSNLGSDYTDELGHLIHYSDAYHGFHATLTNGIYDMSPNDRFSQRIPYAINDQGTAVGTFNGSSYNSVTTSFQYSEDLQGPQITPMAGNGWDPFCSVRCINNNFTMAGQLLDMNDPQRYQLWIMLCQQLNPIAPWRLFEQMMPQTDFYATAPGDFRSHLRSITNDPHYTEADFKHINNNNQVVGREEYMPNPQYAAGYSHENTIGYSRAVVISQIQTDSGWLGGTTFEDLGAFAQNGKNSTATCNDDNGDVVGFADGVVGNTLGDNAYDDFKRIWYGNRHAFLHTPGQSLIDLGALPLRDYSEAYGVNNARTVVGECGDATYNSNRNTSAFVWDPINQMRDLNDLIAPNTGFYLHKANAINESGAITGQMDVNGEKHAYLAIPSVIKSFTVSDTEVKGLGFQTVTGTVTLSAPATCDLCVHLDTPGWPNVYDWQWIQIPAGQTVGTFYITFYNDGVDKVVPTFLSMGGVTKEMDFHMAP